MALINLLLKIKLVLFFSILFSSVAKPQDEIWVYKNIGEKIPSLNEELKALNIIYTYTNLISIDNVLNYNSDKKNLPVTLKEYFNSNKIIQVSEENEKIKREVFLISRFIYSINFFSYLIVESEVNAEYRKYTVNNLYLVNVNLDELISIVRIASFYKGDGITTQTYTHYMGDNRFTTFHETISSDTILLQESDRVMRRKQSVDSFSYIIDFKSGLIQFME